MPHLLTYEQKTQRVKVAIKLFQMFLKYDKKQFADLVTGDETWVYYFEQVRKVSNKIWATKHNKRPIMPNVLWVQRRFSFLLLHIRAAVFVLYGDLKKISPYIHLMLLLYQSSGIVYPIIFSISLLRRLPVLHRRSLVDRYSFLVVHV